MDALGVAHHVDIDRDVNTREELLKYLAEAIGRDSRWRLRDYIDEVMSSRYDDQFFVDLWNSTPSEWYASDEDGKGIRRLLTDLRAYL